MSSLEKSTSKTTFTLTWTWLLDPQTSDVIIDNKNLKTRRKLIGHHHVDLVRLVGAPETTTMTLSNMSFCSEFAIEPWHVSSETLLGSP
ncbi:unnamed protein product, partial [Vitis vinifera]|uniref:Uncharacterized protein n=1 Tax=Vitis vinifera TaxID=29760 RepID=D7TT03_VITVI